MLLREFAVSGMRLVAVEKGMLIAAAWSGKVETTEHDGLHLPDAFRHPPLAEPRLPGRHPASQATVCTKDRHLREKLGRVPGELTNNPQREEPSVMILSAVSCALFPYASIGVIYVLIKKEFPAAFPWEIFSALLYMAELWLIALIAAVLLLLRRKKAVCPAGACTRGQ
ncbi:MAG: hypothetical protein V8S81_09465 [Oscillospiraceae bacterium]